MSSINAPLLDAPNWSHETIPSVAQSPDLTIASKSLKPVSSAGWWRRTLESIVSPILVISLLLIAAPYDVDGEDDF